MKNVHILLVLLLMLPIVIAVETVPISVQAEIRYDWHDENSADLIIIGEGHDEFLNPNSFLFKIRYNNTINNATNVSTGLYVEKGDNTKLSPIGTIITFFVSKNLGNQSELFDIVATCNEMANFSNLWELCIEQRTGFELIIANDMVNKTYHNDIEGNLTTKFTNLENDYNKYKTNKDAEVLEKNERIGDLERHRQWGWGGFIIGIGTAIYLLNKYEGFGKRKQQIETEFPRDVAV